MDDNPCVPKSCKGNCTYSVTEDACITCGRTMSEIRMAYTKTKQEI